MGKSLWYWDLNIWLYCTSSKYLRPPKTTKAIFAMQTYNILQSEDCIQSFWLAEICLSLASGARDGCCSIFQIWMIHFLPSAAGSGHLTSFWSPSRTFPLFPPIDSCWSKAPQEVHIFVASIYICLGWESRPTGVHVLLAVTRWAITTKRTVCFVKIYDCKV